MASPIIKSLPPLKAVSGRKYLYQPVATDVDNDIDHWTLTGMPTGMVFDAVTGRISWIPAAGITTSGSMTLSAVDLLSNTTSQTFTLTVNTPPHIISTAPFSADNNALFNYQLVAEDPESNMGGAPWTLINPPAGMSIVASSGLISWTPTSTGTYSFIARVTDSGGLYDSQVVTLVVA